MSSGTGAIAQGPAGAAGLVARWPRLALSFLIGMLFLLPHLVRIEKLGGYAAYSPFSGRSYSPMTWDETFLYGTEAEYTLTRGGAPAYDDTWEHRAQVYPYSYLPTMLEAGLAALVGGLKTAHLVISFLFPALTAYLLMRMMARAGAASALSGLVALSVLVCGFSARTLLLDDQSFLLHGRGFHAIDALQAIRTPNPGMTFVQYLLALYCAVQAFQWQADTRRSTAWAAAAGCAGGLLFYSYAYYAIPWSATVALLAALSLWKGSGVPRSMLAGLAVSVGVTLPFLWWKHLAMEQGSYGARSTRLGMQLGRGLHRDAVEATAVWGAFALICLLLSHCLRGPVKANGVDLWTRSLVRVLVLAMMGAVAALHMQVVTGFTVQAEFHLAHMVLQPLATLLAGVVLVMAWNRMRWPAWGPAVCFGMLFCASAVAQFEARGTRYICIG